jgi:hypothetical protein
VIHYGKNVIPLMLKDDKCYKKDELAFKNMTSMPEESEGTTI